MMTDRQTPTTQNDFVQYLKGYGSLLDEACATACRAVYNSGDWSISELQKGYDELWRLSEGKDLAYDRPSIGLHYALWYHLQRTQTLIRVLAPLLRARQGRISIYDIGCGTGATAWAAAIISAAMREIGNQTPLIRVSGTDTSPFMLDIGCHLWHALCDRLNIDQEFYKTDHGDWTALPSNYEHGGYKLLVCSWLLNATDSTYLDEIKSWLTKTADRVGADQMLLLSSPGKQRIVNKLAESRYWSDITDNPNSIQPLPALWNSKIQEVAKVHSALLDRIDRKSSEPCWMTSGKPPSKRLLQRQREQIPGLSGPKPTELNDEQDKAAEPTERLTAIVGAAGSGKSLVIRERVVRVIEQASAAEPPRILVTAFNKLMVDQLAKWTLARIKRSELKLHIKRHLKFKDRSQELEVTNSGVTAIIYFLNYDKLPTRVWEKGPCRNPFTSITASDSRLSTRSRPQASKSHLKSNFLEMELRLVLFGLEALDFDRYTDPDHPKPIRRTGRRIRLSRNQRVEVWQALENFCKSEEWSVRCIRRRVTAYLNNKQRLTAGQQMKLQKRYRGLTHVFVDEAQDMTRADLRMLAHTPPKPQRLFIAGDSAQALHTGGTSPRPDIAGARWDPQNLTGSYRLPALVCTALQPLAEHITEAQPVRSDESGQHGSIPEVQRSAVPGPRPVIVDGTNTNEMIKAMRTMSHFANSHIKDSSTWRVVHESSSSNPILKTLSQQGIPYCEMSLLKKKGLEFPLVLFPTNTQPPKDETEAEWLYTALTRAKSVVMIAVFEPINEMVAQALALLNPENLMFWDDNARNAWNRLINKK